MAVPLLVKQTNTKKTSSEKTEHYYSLIKQYVFYLRNPVSYTHLDVYKRQLHTVNTCEEQNKPR